MDDQNQDIEAHTASRTRSGAQVSRAHAQGATDNPGLTIFTRRDSAQDQDNTAHQNAHRSAPSTARPRLAGRRTNSARSEVRRLSSLFTPPDAESTEQATPSRLGRFSRNLTVALSGSGSNSVREPLSPIRSFYGNITGQLPPRARKRSKQDFRSYDDAKFEDEMNLPGSGGNGIRVWYESYTTIDWIHDAIKESSRLRRIRNLKGIRGFALNSWDRLQGWIIVTITGIVTALIAGCIVKSEAVLFDLKDGYCARNWRLAKRFCCPYGDAPDWDHPSLNGSAWSYSTPFMPNSAASPSTAHAFKSMLSGVGAGNRILSGWAAPVAGSPAWNSYKSSLTNAANTTLFAALSPVDPETENCPGWITWSQKLGSLKTPNWTAGYAMYFVVAVLWASIASILTIYLTSSELYLADKSTSSPAISKINKKHSAEAQQDGEIAEEPNETTALLSPPRPANGQSSRHRRDSDADSRMESRNFARLANESRAQKAILPRKVLYFATGSGISEVKCILSGFVIHGYLGFWTLFTKSVGLTLSVASGLSLGKEGPFVHIASCVGNIVCRAFPKYENNEGKRREMLSCACAAGVAVAFGAPVGGVLFSLEEVSYYFPSKVMFRSFFCAMVAAATLRAIDPFGTGKIVLFQVTYDKDWHFYEMLFFILIGIFGGLYGAYFTKLNMFWAKNVRAKTWMAKHPIVEVVFITVVSAAFSFFNGYTRMGGVELIADLFSECHEHESLEGLCVSRPSQIGPLVMAILCAMVIKGLLTIITFGIKLPAGIFIPTLAVGACFGRVVGLLVQYVQWTHPEAGFFDWCSTSDTACIVPGVYAMVGAAAALSGVTRTTVSLAVIMFELTGTLTYSVPVMLSILVAKTIADALEHKGIYDLVIDFSGLPYLDSKTEYIWNGVNVTDAMETEIEVICLDAINTVQSLGEKLDRLARGSGYTDGGFPIVTRVSTSSSVAPNSPTLSASIASLTDLPPTTPVPDTCAYQMVGYIAASELEHALSRVVRKNPDLDAETTRCWFKNIPYVRAMQEGEAGVRDSVHMASAGADPLDLSRYVDKAPITVQVHSPLELVHEYFTRLGVRYLIVVDERGLYRGVIFKKSYLKFLADLEKEGGH